MNEWFLAAVFIGVAGAIMPRVGFVLLAIVGAAAWLDWGHGLQWIW